MKMRFLCMVAAVALLGACSSDETAKKGRLPPPLRPLPLRRRGVSLPAARLISSKCRRPRVLRLRQVDLKPEGKDQLAKWVAFLKKYPN